ncbi:MAG: hypothetical protein K0S58_642 [Nitrospira sp.]|nr:hypothetical protein [Nitrospira sp.]
MGLTKRKDSCYIEFLVIGDGKVLRLPSNTYEGRLKMVESGRSYSHPVEAARSID